MAKNKKNKMFGTKLADELIGTAERDIVKAKGGDDVIATYEGNDKIKAGGGNDTITSGTGMDKVWGGKGNDTFVTENGGVKNPKEGYVKIMDFEVGDKIEFCGCFGTKMEQRGKNVWITRRDDVKAVVKGVDVEDLDIDYGNKLITFVADPLA